jgi:hypothetical protein
MIYREIPQSFKAGQPALSVSNIHLTILGAATVVVYLMALSTCAHAQGQGYKSAGFAAFGGSQAQPIVRSMGLRRPAPAVERPTQPSPGPAQDACTVAAIAGSWAGHKLTDGVLRQIDISFTFNRDGTYEYAAGQGNAAWITQRGSYQLARGNQRYPCQITLSPDRNTVRISSTAQLFVLQSTDLMDDKSRTFLYQFPRWAPTNLMLAGTWTDWRNDIGAFRLERN